MDDFQKKKAIRKIIIFALGSVSGSGTGPGDPGSRGPALPAPRDISL